jgi:hypothetical protein
VNLFLAQSEGVGVVAGLASLVSLLMFLSFFYSILCILIPIFIYRIMRNGTRAEEALLRIEQLLRYNKALSPQTSATQPLGPRRTGKTTYLIKPSGFFRVAGTPAICAEGHN